MTRQGQARCIAGLYISSVVLFVPLLPAGAWACWLHYRNPDALSRPLVRQFRLSLAFWLAALLALSLGLSLLVLLAWAGWLILAAIPVWQAAKQQESKHDGAA